ncbi:MAG TPA: DUF3574 domain-containing protein [Stellaceae bacterium]|nr:DUF3574 domain-containing protein [Stellaceae bacterium]
MALAALMLGGCAAAGPNECPLPTQRPMAVAQLFFGRNIAGRPPLSEREWATFAAQVVTPYFPDGFTVFDGQGQWRNPGTGAIARESSKVVVIAAPQTADLAGRLDAVIAAYRSRFDQRSVGLMTNLACAAF